LHRLDPTYPTLKRALQWAAAPAAYGGLHCFISGGHLTAVRRIMRNTTGPLHSDSDAPLTGPQEAAAASLLSQTAAVGDGTVIIIPIADGVPGLRFHYDEALPLERALRKAAALGADGAIRCTVKDGAIASVRLSYESTTGSCTVDDTTPLSPLQARVLTELQAGAAQLENGKITCELVAGFPLVEYEFENSEATAPRPPTPLPPRPPRRDWRKAS